MVGSPEGDTYSDTLTRRTYPDTLARDAYSTHLLGLNHRLQPWPPQVGCNLQAAKNARRTKWTGTAETTNDQKPTTNSDKETLRGFVASCENLFMHLSRCRARRQRPAALHKRQPHSQKFARFAVPISFNPAILSKVFPTKLATKFTTKFTTRFAAKALQLAQEQNREGRFLDRADDFRAPAPNAARRYNLGVYPVCG